ncbi:hypothetical protein [Pectobacterium brasiliense]|uniref:hypothetical protein n=1 Tax=Pectobacterium brasiliense TaxID=180957 RepID=UPI001F08270E|nr:hypothetical protein [Pectobacterium brasiliense]
MKKVGINLFVMGSGERFCNILDKDTGVPLYYPNVYLISEHRNEGKSISTIELVAGSISIYITFLRVGISTL